MFIIRIKMKEVGMMGAFRFLMIGFFSFAAAQMFIFQVIYAYRAFSDFIHNK